MSSPSPTPASTHLAVRPDWLALQQEEILEPELAIVDAHHHLWDHSGNRYFVQDLLGDLDIAMTHNRPSVSNDNPFSESEFRTMKYRPNYPGTFTDLDTARAWVDDYATWYNQHHRHSGIALFTPDAVFDGSWRELWQRRDQAHQAYYEAHPERFRRRPVTPAPADIVGINLPNEDDERLQAA